ncbi:restriction endonuclease subunit S [Flavisolibacter nicotianae]|uniref:restriction endonuclease subunit S n=1 Tax=Flavisolibacter nicotianae TaxID=2364882 RepID=UPI000EAD38C5|nr:restriction endonuclease subunit S [Flavisolibacter nicotianae]
MKEGYKVTEVGELPRDWEVVNLSHLLELLTDFEANGSFADVKENVRVSDSTGYAWYVRATDLENETKLTDVKYVDEKSYAFLKKTKLYGGELLITKRGEIGKVYFFEKPSNILATLAPNLYLLKLNGDVLPKYLYYYFISDKGNASLKRINASTTLGALYKDDVKKLRVPLPPFREQQKITKILSAVDEKIDVIEAQITQTQELKRGLMQRLLTKGIGHTQFKNSPLGEIPESWSVTDLNFIVQEDRGITYGIVQPGPYDENGRYLVRGKDYSNGWVKPEEFFRVSEKVEVPYKRARLKENDLLITIVGAGVGNMQVVPKWLEGANITQTTARIAIDSNKAHFRFCYHVLCSQIGKKNVKLYEKGGAQPGLNLADIKKFLIPLPSPEEQEKIALLLDKIDEKLAVLQEKKDGYQDLKKGLMQQLLTGKLRVNQTNKANEPTQSRSLQPAVEG